MGVSKIKFTQGVTTAPAGQALLGAVGTPVVVSNGDDTDIKEWQFEWIDTGSGTSSIPTGVVQDGTLSTYTFTPDTSGCYLMHLTTRDKAGVVAEDYRVFGVLETSGRLIPSFAAAGDAMNFGGQAKGWSSYVNAYLRQVDAGGGGGGAPTGTGWAHYTSGALDPAAVTAGDTAIVSGALRIASLGSLAAIAVATALTFGSDPASSGYLRFGNNILGIQARNQANTQNIPLLGTDGSDNVQLGDSAGAQGARTVLNGTTGLQVFIGGAQQYLMTAGTITWGSAVSSPTWTQSSNGTASATGATMSFTAQGVTGTGTTTSGSLAFSSGTNSGSTTGNVGNITFSTPVPVGAGTFGAFTFTPGSGQSLTISKLAGLTGILLAAAATYFYIGDGTNTVINLTASAGAGLQIGASGAYFNDSGSFGVRLDYTSLTPRLYCTSGCTAFKINLDDNATAGPFTGAALTLAGQNATGTTSTGGDIILTSGTGTTSAGNTRLQCGGIDSLISTPWQGTVNSQSQQIYRYSGTARSTTNASVNGPTIPIPSGKVVSIVTRYTGRDVSAGTVGDGFTKIVLTQFKNVSGTVTGAATNSISLGVANDTSMSACVVGFTISGTNVILQAQGLTSVTIDWTFSAEVVVD